MRKRKQSTVKHRPLRYRKHKGCFGNGPFECDKVRRRYESFPEDLFISDDRVEKNAINMLEKILKNPDVWLDMRKVNRMSLRFGLVLKAFFDDFKTRYGRRPFYRLPEEPKMRAVLNHLKLTNSQGVDVNKYPDIVCWQIIDWEPDPEDQEKFINNLEPKITSPAQLLHEQIIPKCWSGKRAMAVDSSVIASSIAEVIFNCNDHAYTGSKEHSSFKKWYLGVGEYPDTKEFAFCVYDKGVGIRNRMEQNKEKWFADSVGDVFRSDSDMIRLATEGRSGSEEGVGQGRGQGLKNAINALKLNNGIMTIDSGKGVFSSKHMQTSSDRQVSLEGTMIAFSFPISYTGDRL